jgi:hypothetical protein
MKPSVPCGSLGISASTASNEYASCIGFNISLNENIGQKSNGTVKVHLTGKELVVPSQGIP